MDLERYQFINLAKMPGCLNTEETAWCLGFAAHDIPIFVANKLLKPLGNPPQNGGRYFSGSEIDRLRLDTKWLDKASALLIKHRKVKNDAKPRHHRNCISNLDLSRFRKTGEMRYSQGVTKDEKTNGFIQRAVETFKIHAAPKEIQEPAAIKAYYTAFDSPVSWKPETRTPQETLFSSLKKPARFKRSFGN